MEVVALSSVHTDPVRAEARSALSMENGYEVFGKPFGRMPQIRISAGVSLATTIIVVPHFGQGHCRAGGPTTGGDRESGAILSS